MSSITSISFYVLFFTFLVHTVMGVKPLSSTCSNYQTYASGSSYDKHLDILLNQLSTKVPPTGFGQSSVGGIYDPDTIHGLALCRGDVSYTQCKSCVKTASREIQQRCPNGKRAIIWYDDCLVKYSNINFLGKIDYENKFSKYNFQNVSEGESFNEKTKELLSQISDKAYRSLKLYATGDISFGKADRLYGLVECTRDLSSIQCKKCLNDAITELPSCCHGKGGARVVSGSCNIRYELYPFVRS